MLAQSTYFKRSGVQLLALSSSSSQRLPSSSWRRRLFATSGGRRRGGGTRKRRWAAHQRANKRVDEKKKVEANTTTAENAKSTATADKDRLLFLTEFVRWIQPIRYRFPDARPYSREEGIALAQRIPLFIVLAALLSWDETSPYDLVRIKGPSMLPTMAPDGSDVWLRSTWTWWRKLGLQPPYQRGDIVGFNHPDHPEHISCKRIVGLPGDRVQRYGQYVHLFIEQDPENLGMMWPEQDEAHSWFDCNCEWDKDIRSSRVVADDRHQHQQQEEAKRTLVVPEGHVWLEADCPALGIDSRHYGPVPMDWLQGKIVAKLWPLWRNNNSNTTTTGLGNDDKRPHPIPLDKETLAQYNVYAVTTTTTVMTTTPDPTSTTD